MKSLLIGKDPDAGEDWRQKEKEAAEDEMVGWPDQVSGCESEQTLGDSEGQRSLAAAVHGVAESWTQLRDGTTAIYIGQGQPASLSPPLPTLISPGNVLAHTSSTV